MDVEKFLAEIPTEEDSQQDPLSNDGENRDQVENETPSESPAETNETETSPSQEGEQASKEDDNTPDDNKLPWNKHPRFKAILEESKQLRSEIEEMKQAMAESKEQVVKTKPLPVPEDFTVLFGENPEAWQRYQSLQNRFKEEAKQEVMREQQERTMAEQARFEAAKKSTDQAFQKMRDDGIDFDENRLQKFVLSDQESNGRLITNARGEIDFETYYRLMAIEDAPRISEEKQRNRTRKEIAASTLSNTMSESKPRNVMTSQDLRNLDWDQLY